MLEALISAMVAGILVGGLYAAVAVGLSLIFGVIRVINFAHGSILMICIYTGYWLWYFFRIDPYATIIIVVPLSFLIGYGVQRVLIQPLFVREKAYVVEPLAVLLLMAGLDLMLSNGALLVFKAKFRSVTVAYGVATIHLGPLIINTARLVLFILSLLVTVGLAWLLARTEFGNNIRAVGQNREAAALSGLDVYHIYGLTFGLGCSIAALGGCAMISFYPIHPYMGLPLAVKSFIIVVLGGVGSIPGAFVGALIIGVVEAVGGQFIPATAAYIFSLILFLLIVFIRPKGLMGLLEA